MAWIFLHKPSGIRSVQCLTLIKKALKLKKAGIAGILDEFACGLLPIATDETTKLIDIHKDIILKEYIFTIKWGSKTDTGDYTGSIIEENINKPLEQDILNIIPSFIGKIQQIPPLYSNIRVNGIRAHQLARQGKDIVMEPREVFIQNLILIVNDDENATFKVTVGHGTYIRSLANAISTSLNTVGHLSYLYRSKIIIKNNEWIPTIDLQYFNNKLLNSRNIFN